MKKIYRNRLPKGMEVENTNIRVENGELVVDVEFKEKFEPKDGDFCVNKNGCIFIYNSNYKLRGNYLLGYYVGIDCYNDITINEDNRFGFSNEVRCATPEEKADFLKRLEKKCSKRWNAEKKCLEDIYIPKFGDIVRIEYPDIKAFKRDYVISIFPNKKVPVKSRECFFDIATINMEGGINIKDSHADYNHNHVFLASESEKQELFDKLAEVGKRWNPETKGLEDIRWKPKARECYFYADYDGKVKKAVNVTVCDAFRISANNCFKTEEAAKPYAEQMKGIFKNSKAE